mmetsp:Transcript_29496/g.57836  ORF Transcript_29496/g.57836 Transcript_29496/m.57836 type:complete len:99 (+) Transcript_29496:3-299(+)
MPLAQSARQSPLTAGAKCLYNICDQHVNAVTRRATASSTKLHCAATIPTAVQKVYCTAHGDLTPRSLRKDMPADTSRHFSHRRHLSNSSNETIAANAA